MLKLNAAQAARRLAASNDAYLVSKGVRALALCGICEARPRKITATLAMLHEATNWSDAKPFVFQVGKRAYYGYCSEPWALNLYRWLIENKGVLPEEHTDAINGMLHGYSPSAIDAFIRAEAAQKDSC